MVILYISNQLVDVRLVIILDTLLSPTQDV